MRLLLSLLMLIGLASCDPSKKSQTSKYPLNGTWVPVREVMGGKELPPVSFSTQKLIIADDHYIFNAESEDTGDLSYANGTMDIYGRKGVNTGKHFMTRYKMENGHLIICYNLAGTAYPADFETKGKPGYFLAEYEKK